MTKILPAADVLDRAAATFRERAAVYKDNYRRVGEMMVGMFPDGITLRTADDHNRFHILMLKIVKLSRYAVAWADGGHQDSIHDDLVYSAMLEAIDDEIRTRESAEITMAEMAARAMARAAQPTDSPVTWIVEEPLLAPVATLSDEATAAPVAQPEPASPQDGVTAGHPVYDPRIAVVGTVAARVAERPGRLVPRMPDPGEAPLVEAGGVGAREPRVGPGGIREDGSH